MHTRILRHLNNATKDVVGAENLAPTHHLKKALLTAAVDLRTWLRFPRGVCLSLLTTLQGSQPTAISRRSLRHVLQSTARLFI